MNYMISCLSQMFLIINSYSKINICTQQKDVKIQTSSLVKTNFNILFFWTLVHYHSSNFISLEIFSFILLLLIKLCILHFQRLLTKQIKVSIVIFQQQGFRLIKYCKMPNNFIQTKQPSNSNFLSLLTKRERAKSVPNLKSDWPGKANPNFALTARIPTNIHTYKINPSKQSKTLLTLLKPKFLNNLPHISLSQSGKLELKPCYSGRRKGQRNVGISSRQTFSRSSRKKQAVIQIQQNEDTVSTSHIFKNSKISRKVQQVIDQEMHLTARQKLVQQNEKQVQKIQILSGFGEFQEEFQRKLSSRAIPERQQLNKKYKIDFLAFGYVEKIIQNPELWQKYVHKIDSSNNIF